MAHDLQYVRVTLRMEIFMLKLALTNLALILTLSVNASAAESICNQYNEIVSKQCVSSSKLKSDLSAEMLRGYTIKGCRNDAFKSILESDVFADSACKPVMAGKLISALK